MDEQYSVSEFATKIRQKYKAYDDIDDDKLVDTFVKKYPTYKDRLKKEEEITLGQTAASLGVEVGGSLASQAAGYGLAPFTLGASAIVLPFLGGVSSSIAAQTSVEGKDLSDISYGRALSAGLINLIPGAAATKLARPIAREAIRGAGIAGADITLQKVIDEKRLPNKAEMATAIGIGSGFGGAMGKFFKGRELSKVKRFKKNAEGIFGMDVNAVDRAILQSTEEGEKLRKIIQDATGVKMDEEEVRKRTNNLGLKIVAQKENNKKLKLHEGWGEVDDYITDLAPTLRLGPGIKQTTFDLRAKISAVNDISKRLPKQIRDKMFLKSKEQQDEIGKKIDDFLDGKPMDPSIAEENWAGNLAKYKEREDELYKSWARVLKEEKPSEWDPFFDELGTPAERKFLADKLQRAIEGKSPTRQYKVLIGAQEDGVRMQYPSIEKLGGTEGKEYLELYDDILAQQIKYNTRSNKNPYGLLVSAAEKKADQARLDELYGKGKVKTKLFTNDELTGKDSKSGLIKKHIEDLHKRSASAVKVKNVMPGNIEYVLGNHIPGNIETAYLNPVTDFGMRMETGLKLPDIIMGKFEADVAMLNTLQKQGKLERFVNESKGLTEKVPTQVLNLSAGPEGSYLYTDPQTAKALKLFYMGDPDDIFGVGKIESPILRFANQTFKSMMAASKAVKVILNPPSYAVNFMSGQITLLGAGIFPTASSIKGYTRGAKVAVNESQLTNAFAAMVRKPGPQKRKAFLDLIEEYQENGIMNGNIVTEDLIATLKTGGLAGKVGAAVKSPFDFFGKAYSVTDIAARASMYEQTKKTLTRLFPEFGQVQNAKLLQKSAAGITNDTYQNYDRVGRIARFLTRVGLMPQFVTFTLEFSRNMYNQAVIARMMSMGDIAGLAAKYNVPENIAQSVDKGAFMREGAKRVAMLSGVVGLGAAGPAMWNASQGISEEDDDNMKKFMESWNKNKSLLYYKSKDGTIAAANASYIMPHAMIGAVIDAGLDGKDESSVIGFITEEFVGDGTFLNQELMRAVDNRTVRGKPITYATGDAERFRDLFNYVVKATYEPGFVRELEKYVASLDEDSLYSTQEVLRRQAGLRFRKHDFKEDAPYEFQDLSRAYSGYKGEYTTAYRYYTGEYKGQRTVNEEQLNDAYEKANDGARRAYELMQDRVQSLKSIGKIINISPDEVMEIVAGPRSNISRSNAYRLVKGLPYKDLDRSPAQTAEVKYEELFGVGTNISDYSEAQIRDKINEIRFSNPMDFKEILNQHRQRIRIEKSNLSTEDKLLKSLSSKDRAEIILELGLHKNYEEKRRMQRAGIWTPDVDMIIRSEQ